MQAPLSGRAPARRFPQGRRSVQGPAARAARLREVRAVRGDGSVGDLAAAAVCCPGHGAAAAVPRQPAPAERSTFPTRRYLP